MNCRYSYFAVSKTGATSLGPATNKAISFRLSRTPLGLWDRMTLGLDVNKRDDKRET